jgi:hypothetical protein
MPISVGLMNSRNRAAANGISEHEPAALRTARLHPDPRKLAFTAGWRLKVSICRGQIVSR